MTLWNVGAFLFAACFAGNPNLGTDTVQEIVDALPHARMLVLGVGGLSDSVWVPFVFGRVLVGDTIPFPCSAISFGGALLLLCCRCCCCCSLIDGIPMN